MSKRTIILLAVVMFFNLVLVTLGVTAQLLISPYGHATCGAVLVVLPLLFEGEIGATH